ncbi:MAG: hypothetical protein M3437_17375 [Chloroflexota bacterium]|nr:hypothetical protein [Chloroflexota bacterium]MDQ5867621.1 hypothetical protein [Chloroflexota bacterium]
MLITLGILHLYAVIYSRGAALTSATVAFAIVTFMWGVWVILDWRVQSEGEASILRATWEALKQNTSNRLPIIALLVWVIGVVWAVWLGHKKSMGPIRLASSYFLGMGACVFGLWGVWALLIQSDHIRGDAFQFMLVMALVIPVALLMVLLWRKKPSGPAGQVLATWFFPIMAYLLVFEIFVRIAEFSLGRFLPKILGFSPLNTPGLSWMGGILQWRGLILSLMVAGIVISLSVLSSAEAIVGFRATRLPTLRRRAQHGTHNPSVSIGDLAEGIADFVGSLGHLISNAAAFVGVVAMRFAQNLREAVLNALPYLRKLVKYVLAPAAAFSVLSVLIIVVLSLFSDYERGILEGDPKALWGAVLIVLVLVLALCAASFGFAPARSAFEVFSVTKAATFIAIILYFVVSTASAAFFLVWIGLLSLKVDFVGVRPGPIYWLNLIAVVSVATALAFTVQPESLQKWLFSKMPNYASWRRRMQVAFLIIPCAIGVAMGAGVVLQGVLQGFR